MTRMLKVVIPTIILTVILIWFTTSCDVRRVPMRFAPRETRQLTHCPDVSGQAAIRLREASGPVRFYVHTITVGHGKSFIGYLRVPGETINLGYIRSNTCVSLLITEKLGRSVQATFDLTSGEYQSTNFILDNYRQWRFSWIKIIDVLGTTGKAKNVIEKGLRKSLLVFGQKSAFITCVSTMRQSFLVDQRRLKLL